MKDLSVLVIDQVSAPAVPRSYKMDLDDERGLIDLIFLQGTIVDRIDYNIQSVATSVEEGFKQLEKVVLFLSRANQCFY